MIHQLIFAAPKPGLSAEGFKSYWVDFHAVDYAAKIRQIRKYLVATRIPLDYGRPLPHFEGVAEIWLKDEAEQLQSLQSPEFLDGARQDEPRWAAFWLTFVHETDTDGHSESRTGDSEYVKLYTFLKRKPSSTLDDFRAGLKSGYERLPEDTIVLGNKVAFAKDGGYQLGEPRFDAIVITSFRNAEDMSGAMQSGYMKAANDTNLHLSDEKYIFHFAAKENWIIRER